MKLELPEHKKLVHTLVMPIRWGDMDAMGQTFIAGGTFDEYPNSLEKIPRRMSTDSMKIMGGQDIANLIECESEKVRQAQRGIACMSGAKG